MVNFRKVCAQMNGGSTVIEDLRSMIIWQKLAGYISKVGITYTREIYTASCHPRKHICKNTPVAQHHLGGKVFVFIPKSGAMIQFEENNFQMGGSTTAYLWISLRLSLSLSLFCFFQYIYQFFSMYHLRFNDHLGKPTWNIDAKPEIVLDTCDNLEIQH